MNTAAITQPFALPLVDGDKLFLDNSSMEVFQTCQRAAQYALCDRRRTASASPALHFGGIVHKCLEARYRSCAAGCAQTDQITATMVAIAQAEYAKWQPPEDDFRTLDTAVRLIEEYGKQYPFETFDLVKTPAGAPFVEQAFCFQLGQIVVNKDMWVQPMRMNEQRQVVKYGPPEFQHVVMITVFWTGKIDLAYTSYGQHYILDHKTSSMATNMAEFEIAHQFYGYAAAVEEILGVEVAGTVINRIVCRKPTKTGIPFTFERKLITIQRPLLAEWREDMKAMIGDFIGTVVRQYAPKQTAWCVGKFGTCQFHQVCQQPSKEQRDILLHSGEYEENVWSPLT